MLRLDRSTIAAPACLADYSHQPHDWQDLAGFCKQRVRRALVELQGIAGITCHDPGEYGLRCAYCEGRICQEGHIEHFRRRNPRHGYPELTFEWSNLFLACGAREHCGHFKDRRNAPPYDPDQLIKPDLHDAGHYLYFHATGQVSARHGLDEQDRQRAIATISVFGLDAPTLAGARARAVNRYRKMKQADFEELASWDVASRNEYLHAEIEATREIPYATTIRDILQG